MRYIGIDLGDKRTGVAIIDDCTRIATPVAVIEVPRDRRAGADLLESIRSTVDEHVGLSARFELVVGLPLNMDGTEGVRATLTRRFAEALGRHLGRPVHFQDERSTTEEADRTLARTGLTRQEKKVRVDAIAASVILNDFLSQQSRTSPGECPE